MTFTLTTEVTLTAIDAQHADNLINDLLDRLGDVETADLGIAWDNCDWKELN
jgi:hypothetical protein